MTESSQFPTKPASAAPANGEGTHGKRRHIVLTSHPSRFGSKAVPIQWGHPDPQQRGPIVATVTDASHRNVIGTHSGSYAVYRALAVASGVLQADHKPDFTNTDPAIAVGPHPRWADPERIVSLDPYGAMTAEVFRPFIEKGFDVRPSIAITKAHIQLPELVDAIRQGRVQVDNRLMKEGGDLVVTKAAIEPVWYLPGVAWW